VNIGNGDELLQAAVAESPIETVCCLEWDPFTLDDAITGGAGLWNAVSPNFRANRTDVAALNHPWNDNLVAFGGGGHERRHHLHRRRRRAGEQIICYSPTTINGASPTEGISLQRQARITPLAPLTINVPLKGINGFTVDGGDATTPLTLGAASSISGRANLRSNTVSLRDNGSLLGITDLTVGSGVTLRFEQQHGRRESVAESSRRRDHDLRTHREQCHDQSRRRIHDYRGSRRGSGH
jgi:hypothetical protein